MKTLRPYLLVALLLGVALWQHGSAARQLEIPIQVDPEKQVLLLTTSWCGYCETAREFLTRNGVEFTEYDVERQTAGGDLYRQLGEYGVPVMVVDGRPIFGMDVAAWVRELEAP